MSVSSPAAGTPLAWPDGDRAAATERGRHRAPEPAGISEWARWPVLAITAAVAAVLGATSGRFGYFADELYFLAAGRRLSWSYADQPPLVPLLARALDTLFPDSVAALRLPATVATALGVIVASLIARELGGGRRAQVLAAASYAVSGGLLGTGHLLSTDVIDSLGWTVITWLLVRWVRTRRDGLLLWSALVTTVCLQTKDLIVVFWVVLAIAALVVGPRDLLRRPLLWLGGAIAVAVSLPNLWWQAQHGWPQLDMTRAIEAEQNLLGGRLTLLPLILLFAGIPVGAVLFCYGTWRLLRSAELRAYRFLGWTIVGVVALFLAAGGRQNYITGLFALATGAAVVEIGRRRPAGWWRWATTWPAVVLAGVLTVAITLPVRPLEWDGGGPVSPVSGLSTGWPELTTAVADALHTLPRGERQGAVILADTYWQASAIDQFGAAEGLPSVYSGSRGFWYFGPPPDSARSALFVGVDARAMHRYFGSVRKIGSFDNRYGVPGINTDVSMWICSDRRIPWSQAWPELRDFIVTDRTDPALESADPDGTRTVSLSER
jgi:4-amino-4-deoxy-L-arabinose transferase-like glycosyltransferase